LSEELVIEVDALFVSIVSIAPVSSVLYGSRVQVSIHPPLRAALPLTCVVLEESTKASS